jgi:hypothetical protein
MPIDSLPDFCSIAKIKVLVIPVGTIQRSKFLEYFGLISQFQVVNLSDITPDLSGGPSNAVLHLIT